MNSITWNAVAITFQLQHNMIHFQNFIDTVNAIRGNEKRIHKNVAIENACSRIFTCYRFVLDPMMIIISEYNAYLISVPFHIAFELSHVCPKYYLASTKTDFRARLVDVLIVCHFIVCVILNSISQ